MAVYAPSRETMSELAVFVERSPEASEYLAKRFDQVTERTFPDITQALVVFADSVSQQYTVNVNPYAGMKVPPPHVQLEQTSSPPLPKPPESIATRIALEVTIHPDSKMDRRYKVDGDDLHSGETSAYLDGKFRDWFAEHQIRREKGIMYLVDKDNKAIPIPPGTLEAMLKDPDQGLQAFVREQSQGTHNIKQLEVTQVVPTPETTPGA